MTGILIAIATRLVSVINATVVVYVRVFVLMELLKSNATKALETQELLIIVKNAFERIIYRDVRAMIAQSKFGFISDRDYHK